MKIITKSRNTITTKVFGFLACVKDPSAWETAPIAVVEPPSAWEAKLLAVVKPPSAWELIPLAITQGITNFSNYKTFSIWVS